MLMLLPSELLTLLVLSRAVIAFPQNAIPANATASLPIERVGADASETPSTEDDGLDSCRIDPKSCGQRERPALPTATGWDDTEVNSFDFAAPTPTKSVLTSNVPTIIDVETNTVVRGGPAFSSATRDDVIKESQGQIKIATQEETIGPSATPKERAGNPAGNIPSTVVLSDPQQTPQNSLLLDIVSRLGQTQYSTQPTPPSPLVTDALGEDSAVYTTTQTHENGITPGPNTASATASTPGITGNSITLGSAVIPLTPGISTTIGPSSDQTFLAITTNAAGTTLVTISSSGVAVTATVSTVPTIVTLPKAGFEASVTDVARPGVYTSRLSTTSSKGIAIDSKRSEVGWWTSAMLGFVGLVLGI